VRPLRISILLIAAVAVAACGSDDEPAKEPASRAPAAATGPTARAENADNAEKGKPKQRRDRATTEERAGSTSDSSPPEEEQPQQQPPPTTKERDRGSIDRDYYDAAKRVCGALPIERFARALESESSDPDAVARAYAQRYPADRRRAVQDGCLAGLR
jgi:hypothetical protein